MLVSIIIINYNTFELTCNCIESVIEHTQKIPYEIVLVDNASTKDNPDEFKKKYNEITLIKSPDNGGFAKGNNLGIKHAKGDIILLLNSDCLLTEDSISASAEKLINTDDIGVLSTKLTYQDGKYQSNARKFRSIKNELLDLVRPILLLLPYQHRAKLMLNQYFNGDFDTYCDWVSGAFMMFRKSVLEDLPDNKLDERFFMYGEDHLWCSQIMEAGYKSYFLSTASTIHIANASTEPKKQMKILKTMLKHELIIYNYRHNNPLQKAAFKLIFTFKEMARYYVKLVVLKLFKRKMR